jgi:hypothetical protein
VQWTSRPGASGLDNEETQKRIQAVFGKWSPSPSGTIHQYVGRIDGRGGFAVVDTDDANAMAGDLSVFTPYFDYTVFPVIDIQELVGVGQAAIELRDSV